MYAHLQPLAFRNLDRRSEGPVPLDRARKKNGGPTVVQRRSSKRQGHVMAATSSADFWIGANIPWNAYGNDVGRKLYNPSTGTSHDYYKKAFQKLQAAGANTARFWLFGDGRSHPFFQANLDPYSGNDGSHPNYYNRNKVIKYPGGWNGDDPASQNAFENQFWSDFEDILELAKKYHIGLIPVFWDFHAMDATHYANKDWKSQLGHKDLFADEYLTTQYIDLALIPLVKRFSGHPNLLAWDIINEPEWALDATFGDTGRKQLVPGDQLVPLARMQEFVARCAAAIHEHAPGALVTLGSNCIQFSWPFPGDLPSHAVKYWTDESLEAAYQKWPGHKTGSNPTLDIYQYHLYTDFDPRFNPCLPDPKKTLDAAKVHKPILIGEVQVSNNNWPGPWPFDALKVAKERRDAAMKMNYKGMLFWSYGGHEVTGDGDWNTGKLSEFEGALRV